MKLAVDVMDWYDFIVHKMLPCNRYKVDAVLAIYLTKGAILRL